MENINIEATEYTPKVILDEKKNLIEIKGNSFPENSFEFYEPVVEWIKKYFEDGGRSTTINISINYFNSSSSQQFFDIFDFFEEANNNNNSLKINWLYDEKNESAEEAGKDFVEEFENLNINLIQN
jgi:SiaC family regulatory phosphoprotein